MKINYTELDIVALGLCSAAGSNVGWSSCPKAKTPLEQAIRA